MRAARKILAIASVAGGVEAGDETRAMAPANEVVMTLAKAPPPSAG